MVKVGSVVRFVDPCDEVSVVGGEVVEVGDGFLAVDYQGIVIVLDSCVGDGGLYGVCAF